MLLLALVRYYHYCVLLYVDACCCCMLLRVAACCCVLLVVIALIIYTHNMAESTRVLFCIMDSTLNVNNFKYEHVLRVRMYVCHSPLLTPLSSPFSSPLLTPLPSHIADYFPVLPLNYMLVWSECNYWCCCLLGTLVILFVYYFSLSSFPPILFLISLF